MIQPEYLKGRNPSELKLAKCLETLPKGSEFPKSNGSLSYRKLGVKCDLDGKTVERYLSALVDVPLGESGKKIVFEKKTTEVLVLDPEEDPYDEIKRNIRNAFFGSGVALSQFKNVFNTMLPPKHVVCRCGGSGMIVPLIQFNPLNPLVPCPYCQKPLYMKCNCGEFLFINSLSEGERIICNCGRAHIKKGENIEALDTGVV